VKVLGIDHVAICVPDVSAGALPLIDLLGLGIGPREVVEAQKTEAFFLLAGEEAGACIEMIAPAGDNVGLKKFLQKRGSGLHHVAFLVEDLAGALAELDSRGVKLIDKVPRPGARGHLVGFLHPEACGGTLVELVGHRRKG